MCDYHGVTTDPFLVIFILYMFIVIQIHVVQCYSLIFVIRLEEMWLNQCSPNRRQTSGVQASSGECKVSVTNLCYNGTVRTFF